MAQVQEDVLRGNYDAEIAVLGALMAEPNAAQAVMDTLLESDFLTQTNAVVYRAMQSLYKKHQTINITSVGDELQTMGHNGYAIEAGGINLLSMLDVSALPASLPTLVDIILQRSLRKQMADGAAAIYRASLDAANSPNAVLLQAEKLVSGIEVRQSVSAYQVAKDIAAGMWEEINAEANAVEGVPGITTGFGDLDRFMGGFRPGKVYLIGARPGMGKTSLLCSHALAMLLAGKRVGIFSLEMSKESILERIVLAHAQVSVDDLRNGDKRVKEDALKKVRESSDYITSLPLYINDKPCTIANVRSLARRMVNVDKVDCIFLDYAQLIRPGKDDNSPRWEHQTAISNSFIGLKKELNIPLVILVQLTREVSTRCDKRPTIADIRDSGAYEQDADVIILIHRDDYYKKAGEEKTGITNLIVAKNRGGPVGEVNVYFYSRETRFAGLETRVDYLTKEKADEYKIPEEDGESL